MCRRGTVVRGESVRGPSCSFLPVCKDEWTAGGSGALCRRTSSHREDTPCAIFDIVRAIRWLEEHVSFQVCHPSVPHSHESTEWRDCSYTEDVGSRCEGDATMKPRRNTQMLPLEKHARKDCFFESAKHRRHLLERKFLGYGASKRRILSPMHDDADAHQVNHCTRRKHCTATVQPRLS